MRGKKVDLIHRDSAGQSGLRVIADFTPPINACVAVAYKQKQGMMPNVPFAFP